MKRFFKGVRLFISFLVMLLCITVSYADSKAADSVSELSGVILGTGDWSPLISPSTEGFGPISQIVLEGFEQADIAPVIRFWPWSRAIENLNEGHVDASYAWRITEERLEKYYFSDAVYDHGNVFFYRKGYPFDWDTIEDLKAYKLAGVQDYAYSDEIVKAEAEGVLTLDRVPDERQLVLLLLAGRIDAFPASLLVGKELIRKHAAEHEKDILIHPKSVSQAPLHVITLKNKQGRRLIDRFNQGLKKLKKSGRYQAITDNFQ